MSPLGPEASPRLLIALWGAETVTGGDQPAAGEGVGAAAAQSASAPISATTTAPDTRATRNRARADRAEMWAATA